MISRNDVIRRLNPLVEPLANRVPPFAVLHHRGRKSGRPYEAPVQAYRTPEGYVVGLGYGYNSAWALNLLAAGEGQMTRAGKQYTITAPRRAGREVFDLLPPWASLMFRAMGIKDFIRFDVTRV